MGLPGHDADRPRLQELEPRRVRGLPDKAANIDGPAQGSGRRGEGRRQAQQRGDIPGRRCDPAFNGAADAGQGEGLRG